MKQATSMFNYQFKMLLREPLTWVLLATFTLLFTVAAMNGKREINRYLQSQSQNAQLIQERNQAYLERRFGDKEKVGRFFYYAQVPVEHRVHPRAALNLSRLDLYEDIPGITLHGIYPQIFNSGLQNPYNAYSGHFDLAFVLIYLLPLLALLLTFDLRQREIELGLQPFFISMGVSERKWVVVKSLLRLGLLALLVTTLNLLAFGYLKLALDGFFIFFNLAALLYGVFWLILGLLISSCRFPSSTNLIFAFITWIGLCVVAPNTLQLLSHQHGAQQSGMQIATEHRYNLHSAWDLPKKATFATFEKTIDDQSTFLKDHDQFTWGWYFAMHSAADFSVQDKVQQAFALAQNQQDWITSKSLWLPPLRLQVLLDKLCGVDLRSHHDFRQEVIGFHQRLKARYYPLIFANEVWSRAELTEVMKNFSPNTVISRPPTSSKFIPLSLLVGCLVLALAAGFQLRPLKHLRRNDRGHHVDPTKRAA